MRKGPFLPPLHTLIFFQTFSSTPLFFVLRVQAPEMADPSTLVSAWAEQNYASRQYNLVVDELLPVLQRTASR